MNKVLFACVVLIVGGGLIAGFMIVGGPGYARMERHDIERASDLRTMGDYYRCVLAQKNRADDAALPPRCTGYEQTPDLTDPTTGEPYRYTRLGPEAFEVCATFQTDAQRDDRNLRYSYLTFTGNEGCVVYGRDPDGDATGATLNRSRD